VNLPDIELALQEHPAVTQAVAVIDTKHGPEGTLIAYVELAGEPDEPALRQYLQQKLPSFMVPAAFERIREWPMLPNGKIDRQTLSADRETRRGTAGREELPLPRTATEAFLAEVWSNVLGLDALNAADDFFDLGGDSVTAMRVLAQVSNRYGVELRLEDVLTSRTLTELARAIDQRTVNALVP
jgi:acyl carrier protein